MFEVDRQGPAGPAGADGSVIGYYSVTGAVSPGDIVIRSTTDGTLYRHVGAGIIADPTRTTPSDFTDTSLWMQVGGGNIDSLNDVGDVTLATPTEGQLLSYDDTNDMWVNRDAPLTGVQVVALSGTATTEAIPAGTVVTGFNRVGYFLLISALAAGATTATAPPTNAVQLDGGVEVYSLQTSPGRNIPANSIVRRFHNNVTEVYFAVTAANNLVASSTIPSTWILLNEDVTTGLALRRAQLSGLTISGGFITGTGEITVELDTTEDFNSLRNYVTNIGTSGAISVGTSYTFTFLDGNTVIYTLTASSIGASTNSPTGVDFRAGNIFALTGFSGAPPGTVTSVDGLRVQESDVEIDQPVLLEGRDISITADTANNTFTIASDFREQNPNVPNFNTSGTRDRNYFLNYPSSGDPAWVADSIPIAPLNPTNDTQYNLQVTTGNVVTWVAESDTNPGIPDVPTRPTDTTQYNLQYGATGDATWVIDTAPDIPNLPTRPTATTQYNLQYGTTGDATWVTDTSPDTPNLPTRPTDTTQYNLQYGATGDATWVADTNITAALSGTDVVTDTTTFNFGSGFTVVQDGTDTNQVNIGVTAAMPQPGAAHFTLALSPTGAHVGETDVLVTATIVLDSAYRFATTDPAVINIFLDSDNTQTLTPSALTGTGNTREFTFTVPTSTTTNPDSYHVSVMVNSTLAGTAQATSPAVVQTFAITAVPAVTATISAVLNPDPIQATVGGTSTLSVSVNAPYHTPTINNVSQPTPQAGITINNNVITVDTTVPAGTYLFDVDIGYRTLSGATATIQNQRYTLTVAAAPPAPPVVDDWYTFIGATAPTAFSSFASQGDAPATGGSDTATGLTGVANGRLYVALPAPAYSTAFGDGGWLFYHNAVFTYDTPTQYTTAITNLPTGYNVYLVSTNDYNGGTSVPALILRR